MGLQVSNVSVKSKDQANNDPAITSFWIEIRDANTKEKPTPHLMIELWAYKSEQARDDGAGHLQLVDTGQGLETDVFAGLFHNKLKSDLTASQYANVPMVTCTDQIRDVLIEGDTHTKWAELFGEAKWAGFGVGNVTTQMPS